MRCVRITVCGLSTTHRIAARVDGKADHKVIVSARGAGQRDARPLPGDHDLERGAIRAAVAGLAAQLDDSDVVVVGLAVRHDQGGTPLGDGGHVEVGTLEKGRAAVLRGAVRMPGGLRRYGRMPGGLKR